MKIHHPPRRKPPSPASEEVAMRGSVIIMSKDWRTIVKFTAVGVTLAMVAAGYVAVSDSAHLDVNMDFLIVLCPAGFFLAWLIEGSAVGRSAYVLWSLAALANAATCALIGAAFVGLRKKPDGSPAN